MDFSPFMLFSSLTLDVDTAGGSIRQSGVTKTSVFWPEDQKGEQ